MSLYGFFYHKCPSCNGTGGKDNPAWDRYNKKVMECTWDYTQPVPDSYLTCGNCNGLGRKARAAGEILDANRRALAKVLRDLSYKIDAK